MHTYWWSAWLQPLRDIHLHSDVAIDQPSGNLSYLLGLEAVTAFILLIACINYINLATARVASRAREIGIRKVLGGSRRMLVCRFLGESIALSSLALLVSVLMLETLLPFTQIATWLGQPSLLLELAELGIALPPPPVSETIVLDVLRALLGAAEPAQVNDFLMRLELGYGLGRIGLQTLPATPEDGAPQDPPVAGAIAAMFAAPPASVGAALDTDAAIASNAEEEPRGILRHHFADDEHAWETITSDLGLLEAQIAACASKGEAMTMLARHMSPAVHHQPLGLMAARVYSQLFALA